MTGELLRFTVRKKKMRKEYYTNSKDYINRWVISYADFVTMLLALFVVMYAVSQIDNGKLQQFQTHLTNTFVENTQSKNVTKYQSQVRDNLINNMQLNASDKSINDEDKLERMFEDYNIPQSKTLKLIKGEKGLTIRINNSMLFDSGSAEIKPEAIKTLTKITKILTKIDNPVIIEGHTDSTPIKSGKYPSNWELSTARATNIIAYMLKTGKISPKRMCASGYGEYMPIADNTLSSGRMLNRRVDIMILNKKK
jgi:chemotaxis protein MotB